MVWHSSRSSASSGSCGHADGLAQVTAGSCVSALDLSTTKTSTGRISTHSKTTRQVRLPVELLVVKVGELEYLGKMGQQVGCLDKALVHLAWPVRVGSMAPQGWRVHQEA